MEKRSIVISLMVILWICQSCKSADFWELTSPDGAVHFTVRNKKSGSDELLQYTVFYQDSLVINASRLGLILDGVELGRNARIVSVGNVKTIDEPYELKAGKRIRTVNNCNELILIFEGREKIQYGLVIRVYNDGVAFRYTIPSESNDIHIINEELTEFAVPADGMAWIHPYDWNSRSKPSYEQYAKSGIKIGSEPDHDKGWAFPMLFQTANGWMMVTEALLDGTYPATHIDNSGKDKAYKIRFPEPEESIIPDPVEPRSILPWKTPWRVIIVGKDLNTVFKTQIVSHLNPPSVVVDESWIRAGRSSWSWWYEGASVTSYKKQIDYVNLSREMGWEYVLIDAGWQRMTDGGTMEDVVKYASEKGVGIWLWYHSGAGRGDNFPTEQRLMSDPVQRRNEMKRIHELGVKGIKVDFFDTDKQEIIKLYPAILQDAIEYKLLINFHGATLPRGFERTYPNLLTTEAIRGAEGFGQQARCDSAAKHDATVVFTRNVVGSMDYTPVTFSNKIRQGVTAYRRTTVAHQLALSVVFESGFQCFADRAEAYRGLSELPKQFLKDVPAAWDESELLAGYPSDFAVVARKSGECWFIGGINGVDEEREVEFILPAACKGKLFTLITDGENKDTFAYEDMLSENGKMKVKLSGNGGFAAKIICNN